MDVIEKIDVFHWVSLIVATLRKNEKVRMCVDFHVPNKAVMVDSHLPVLPHMDDIFSELHGTTVFSTIDLVNAYQVLLAEESHDITAFIAQKGLVRFHRVPYGLFSTPSTFPKLMS